MYSRVSYSLAMAQEKREKHWFQKERRKDRTKDRARMLGKKWEKDKEKESFG